MNKKNFELFEKSIDDNFLEEATLPQKKPTLFFIKKAGTAYIGKSGLFALAAAACLVLVIGAATLGRFSGNSEPPASFAEHNYSLPVPAEAKSIAYELIVENVASPMAEAAFTVEKNNFTLRAMHTSEAQDISGLTAHAEPLVWYADGLELKLCSTNDAAWVSWFDARENTQWCLAANNSSLALLTTANAIVTDLGYNVAVAPEGAADITYNAFQLQDMTVAETSYLYEDIRYSYRMAATYSFDIVDISGMDSSGAITLTEVGWCPAEIQINENGSGKILWLDIVPGLLYSLTMENCATEEALLNTALELFDPAQSEADWK